MTNDKSGIESVVFGAGWGRRRGCYACHKRAEIVEAPMEIVCPRCGAPITVVVAQLEGRAAEALSGRAPGVPDLSEDRDVRRPQSKADRA